MSPTASATVFVFSRAFGLADNGTYAVSLRAADVAGNPVATQPANSTLVVDLRLARPPLANAGSDRTVAAGSPVSLAGSGFNPDGGAVVYSWTSPGGTVLSDPNAPTPSFTPNTPGTYTFR